MHSPASETGPWKPNEIAMRNERVVLGDVGAGQTVKQARSIVIPDVRPLALCLNESEENLLIWSHRVAVDTLEKIVRRQRWNSVTEVYQIDVPDLDGIAQCFPREEKALVLAFWAVYGGLVRHFLRKARPQPYFFNNGVRAGSRFHGECWFSPEPHK